MIRDAVADWQQLSAWYEQAGSMRAEERASWLEGLRHDAHPLFAQLERMLEAQRHIAAAEFLEALPVLESGQERDTPDWGEGSRIGAYRLTRHIGSGGMAEVWLADRVDGAFARQVAMKLLFNHPSRAQRESFVERFRRERDILASLDHRNIARLHDAGVTPTGQPWLALDYIEGESIVDWADRRRLDVAARVRLFVQVLSAVSHAHGQLIIHRDLKPANVMVTGQGVVYLLDFGIAKLIESEGAIAAASELTRSSGHPMTLQFASPEQISGAPLSTASDIYSAAAVLYLLVCGAHAHVVDRRTATGDALPVRPPSRAATDTAAACRGVSGHRALRRAISRDLDAILLHALEASPARRYATADAMAADLLRWERGQPVEARPPSALERAAKFARRHPLGVGLGLASIGALVATTVVAIAMFLSAERESGRARAARDFLLQTFRQSDPDQARGRDLTAREVLSAGRTKAESALGGEPKLQAELLAAIGAVQASIGDTAEADQALSRAAGLYERQRMPREAALAHIARAENLVHRGDYATAEAVLTQASPLVPEASQDHELQARYHDVRGTVAWQSKRLVEAADSFAKAVSHARRGYAADDGRNVDILASLAEVEAELKLWLPARQHAEEALRRGRALEASAPSYFFVAAAASSRVHVLQGELVQGADLLEDALRRCNGALGAQAETCGVLRVRLALAWLRLERAPRAAELLPAMLKTIGSNDSPRRQAEAVVTAFRVRSALGAGAAATEDSERERVSGFARLGETSGRSDEARALALLALAEGSLRRGDPVAALANLDRLGGGPGHGEKGPTDAAPFDLHARTLLIRGLALVQAGRAEQGLDALERAQRGFVARYGNEHPYSLLMTYNTMVALCALGRTVPAESARGASLPLLTDRLGTDSAIVLKRNPPAVPGLASGRSACDPAPVPYYY